MIWHKLWLTLMGDEIEIETQSKLMVAAKWWLLLQLPK